MIMYIFSKYQEMILFETINQNPFYNAKLILNLHKIS